LKKGFRKSHCRGRRKKGVRAILAKKKKERGTRGGQRQEN